MARAVVWILAVGVCVSLAVMACKRRYIRVPVVREGARADLPRRTVQPRADANVAPASPPVPHPLLPSDLASRRECQDPAALARWIVQQWGKNRFEAVRQRLRQMESLVKFTAPYRPISGPLRIESKWSVAMARFGAYRQTRRAWVLSDHEAAVSVELSRGMVDVFFAISSKHRTTPSGARQLCARFVSRWNLYVRPRRVPRQELRNLVSMLARGAFTEAARKYYPYPAGHMLVSVRPRHLQDAWKALIRRKGQFIRIQRLYDADRDGAGRPTLIVRCAFEKGAAEIRFPPPVGRHSQRFLWGYPQFPFARRTDHPRS